MYYFFFYIPAGTELRVRRVPVGVVALSVINLGYFLLFHYSPAHAARVGALALDTAHPSLLTAFTACFIHVDWFHLLGNMVYLVTFGPALEERLGGPKFLLLYLGLGIASMLAQVESTRLLTPGAPMGVLGASGAISGILGLFAVRCGFARVRVAHVTMALLQGQSRAGTSRINSIVAIAAWSFLQLVYGLVAMDRGSTGVAYGSHLGGILLGVGAGFALGLHREARVERVMNLSRRYAGEGKWFAAAGEAETYLQLVPGDAGARLHLARMERLVGRRRESVRAYLKAIDLLWRGRERRRAADAARELRRHYPEAVLRPSLLWRMAQYLERRGDLGWAANSYADFALFFPAHVRAPAALLAAAEIEGRFRNDLFRARRLYDDLAGRYPASPEAARARSRREAVSRVLVNRGLVAPESIC